MFGPEVDLQRVQNSVPDIEMVLKAWLQEQGGDREQLHLLLPGHSAPGTARACRNVEMALFEMALFFHLVCIKCDMQERLISPTLVHLNPSVGVKTENVGDFLRVSKGSANQSQMPARLRAIK